MPLECRQAERLFDLYLDKEIAVRDFHALSRHLAACPRCSDNWLATRKTADLLSALPNQPMEPQSFSRVMMSLPRMKKRVRIFRLIGRPGGFWARIWRKATSAPKPAGIK